MKWYYYLHTNGDLIGKNPVVVDSDPSYFDSDFVQKVWCIETEERGDCWKLVLEALAKGARIDRVKELVEKWKMDKADSFEMIARTPLDEAKPNVLMRGGMSIFIEKILGMDVDEYWKEVKAWGDKEKRRNIKEVIKNEKKRTD